MFSTALRKITVVVKRRKCFSSSPICALVMKRHTFFVWHNKTFQKMRNKVERKAKLER